MGFGSLIINFKIIIYGYAKERDPFSSVVFIITHCTMQNIPLFRETQQFFSE
jgi:hypothetical protein